MCNRVTPLLRTWRIQLFSCVPFFVCHLRVECEASLNVCLVTVWVPTKVINGVNRVVYFNLTN